MMLLWLAGALLLGLAYLMFIGTFSRYWADDFCYLANFQNSPNLLAAVQKSYSSWSNRYANVILFNTAQLFGRRAVSFFPAALLALLALSAFLALRQIAQALQLRLRPLAALCLALALTFFSVLQAPNRFQAVFWLTGLVTYFAPLIFWNLLIFLILRQPRWPALLTIAALALLAAGASETTLVVQVTFLSLWLFFAALQRKQRPPIIGVTVAWLFTMLGFLVVLLSPGNAVRLSYLPERQFTLASSALIVRFAADFALGQLRSFPLPAAVAFGAAFLLGQVTFPGLPKPSAAWFLLPLALTGLLLASLVTPSVYVYGRFGYPEARALFPAAYLLTALILLEGLLLGWRLTFPPRASLPLTLAALLLAAYPLWFIYRDARSLPQIQRYARDWDQRDAEIQQQRQQGNLQITVRGIESPGGLGEIKPDPVFWINRCAADSYNLDSLAIFP